jgi:hypothetical protein
VRRATILLIAMVALSGCGPTMYLVNIAGAASSVEEAREVGAPTQAPYEYYLAESHLEKAREEAAEANYQDAIRFANVAEENAVKARDLARRHMRETGR